MLYHYKKSLSRRTFLHGTGSVLVSLPFLDEMCVRSAYAASPEPPPRAITTFFGLGVPPHVQDDFLGDLSGPMEPLRKHRAKLGFVRGLAFPGTHHLGGGMGAFTGMKEVAGEGKRAGGPSIDQVFLQAHYEGGGPGIGTLGMGLFHTYLTDDTDHRRFKSWKNNGSIGSEVHTSPRALFNRLFGQLPQPSPDDNVARMRRSVLDSVVEQYKYWTGDAGGLGAASRSRVRDHLARVREYEQRAFPDDVPIEPLGPVCARPGEPSDPYNFPSESYKAGINVNVKDLTDTWRLNVDLFALALQCDMTRIAWAHFLNVGDRIDLQGDYRYEGSLIHRFNDAAQLKNTDFGKDFPEDKLVSHEWFHKWNERGDPGGEIAAHHLHFYMREIAYLLTRLDDPDHLDENGGTILDNAMFAMTTELAKPGDHTTRDVFHAIGSGNDRFKTGGNISGRGDRIRPSADMYNALLRGYGIEQTIAPSELDQEMTEIRL